MDELILDLLEDGINENKKLTNLENGVLKKKEEDYNNVKQKYETEIEKAKLNGNIEEIKKRYESIEQELFDNYNLFLYIIYSNLKSKSLKDIIKYRKDYNKQLKNDKLTSLFEDNDEIMKSLYNETIYYRILRKINRQYKKNVMDKIKIIKEFEKLKAQKKIEKLSILFDKKCKTKNLSKDKEIVILEKFDKKINKLLKKIKNKFIKLQKEDEIIKKANKRETKILEKLKKRNEYIEKRNNKIYEKIIKIHNNIYDRKYKKLQNKKQKQYKKIKKIKDNKKKIEKYEEYVKEYDKEFNKFYEKKNKQWDKIMKLIYPNTYKNKKENNNN